MTIERSAVVTVAGAVVAVLLQVLLAPNIALYGSFPDIPLVYVMAVAVARPADAGPVMPFSVGLVCDLLGSGPVGAEAFLFVAASVVVSRVFLVMNNDTLFMPFASMFVGVFAVEAAYGVFLLATGYPATFLGALLHRAIPCALYDCVVAILVYPLLMSLFPEESALSRILSPKLR